MAQDAGDVVLPASCITADRHLSLSRKIMPEDAAVRVGESWPRLRYPERSVHLLSFAMAGLIPPFSGFFHEVLDFYEIHALHLAPNAMMMLAIFAHLCKMFIGVRPTMRLFQSFFVPQLLQGAVVGDVTSSPGQARRSNTSRVISARNGRTGRRTCSTPRCRTTCYFGSPPALPNDPPHG